MQRISINGIEAEHLSIMDRAVHYGDGLFETIACRNGALQFWDAHLSRMKHGAEILGITFPDENKYLNDVKALLAPSTGNNYIIKLLLTRGSGERGYRNPQTQKPARVVIISDLSEPNKEYIEQGVKVCLCEHTVSINPKLAGIKHLNRLDNVLARNEWNDECQEGFMFDTNGKLIEGTMSNVFSVKDEILYTPKLDQCGVNGIIRQQVLSIAKEKNVETCVEDMHIDIFNSMDEIFITNSIIGIWPVNCVGEIKYQVGDMTRNLKKELKQRIRENAKNIA